MPSDLSGVVPGFRTRSRAERGKQSAERRIVQPMSAQSAAARLGLSRPLLFAGEDRGGGTPPFGAHACGTRHRLLPRWLSPGTGFPAALAGGFCPLRQALPQLSTLRADRSWCRSTGDPEPPGCGWQAARGHRASLSSLRHAFRKFLFCLRYSGVGGPNRNPTTGLAPPDRHRPRRVGCVWVAQKAEGCGHRYLIVAISLRQQSLGQCAGVFCC